jgi:hypothetical protein
LVYRTVIDGERYRGYMQVWLSHSELRGLYPVIPIVKADLCASRLMLYQSNSRELLIEEMVDFRCKGRAPSVQDDLLVRT